MTISENNNNNFSGGLRLFLIFFTVFATAELVHSDNTDDNTTDYDFSNFTNALKSIVIEQQEFFDWMETVLDYIAVFNDNAGKASSLMVKTMKKIFNVDSPEEKALKHLSNIIRSSAAITRALARQFFKTEQAGYRRDVSDKLGTSHKYISKLFNHNRNTTLYPEFQQLCSLQNQERPSYVLNTLNNILYEECRKETVEERQTERKNNLEKARNFFHQLDENFEFKLVKDNDYNNVKDLVYATISASSTAKADMLVADLAKVAYSQEFNNSNFEKKATLLVNVLPPKVPGSCYLMAALDGHGFKHEDTTKEIVPVVYDVTFSSFASVVCAYVNYEDDPAKLIAEMKDIQNMTNNIIKNIPIFLQQQLENAWFHGDIKEAVIRSINDSILLLENYTAVAIEAQAKINLMGNPRFLHEIVIANNAFDGFYFKCDPFYCTTIKDHYNMVNVFISRFEKADYDRMELAAEWWTKEIQDKIDNYLIVNGYQPPGIIANGLDQLLNVSHIFRGLLVNQERSVTFFIRHLNKQKTPDFEFRGLKQSQTYRRVSHYTFFYDNAIDWLL